MYGKTGCPIGYESDILQTRIEEKVEEKQKTPCICPKSLVK